MGYPKQPLSQAESDAAARRLGAMILAERQTPAYAAGFRDGCLAMREAAAKACIERSVRVGHRALPISTGQACADAIRVLPLPEMPK